MKPIFASLVMLTYCLTNTDAQAFYNPSTGRWLSRDPVNDIAFKSAVHNRRGLNIELEQNLYGFVKNNPIPKIDALGLADYQILYLTPEGTFKLTLNDVTYNDPVDGTITTAKGFWLRYIPLDGKHGRPACSCPIKDIFLAQTVIDAVGHPAQFDTGKPGTLPQHNPKDPIPKYAGMGNLVIKDAPQSQSQGMEGLRTWKFEDCAVCRMKAKDGSIVDKVMGCVAFELIYQGDGKTPAVTPGGAMAPVPAGDLWQKALTDWRTRRGGP